MKSPHKASIGGGRWRSWRTGLIALVATTLVGAGAAVGLSVASAASVDTNAWYAMVNRNSGKALDLYNFATTDAAPIVQWARNDLYGQQWQFVDAGSGYYKIKSRHSGKFLELPNATDGTQLVQNPDNGSTRQQFTLKDSADGYVRLINRHSGKALEIWEWSTADGGIVAQYADLDGANQQWQLVNLGTGAGGGTTTPPPSSGGGSSTGLVGWATQNGGTTGGGSAATTTVTTAAALTTAVGSTAAAVIRVSGNISCSGMLRVRSNKTIIGNSGATITGCGLNINGDRNVIIRNLNFTGWDDDAINIQESATNIWVDHNSFSNGYDGAVDVKRASDFVTISWNRVFNHDKNMLLGHSDDNGSQDVGHLRVTYHHNYFDGTTQRNPRVRFGNPVHVYNNFFRSNSGYGVASTEGAGVLVEGNYFENVPDPYHLGEADSGPGTLVARNNYSTGSGAGQTGGSVASIPYSYSLDTASGVKSIVVAGAGAGKISL